VGFGVGALVGVAVVGAGVGAGVVGAGVVVAAPCKLRVAGVGAAVGENDGSSSTSSYESYDVRRRCREVVAV